MRAILLLTLALAVVAAGCAEGPGGGDDLVVPSTTEASALFAQAASDLPDEYGVAMKVVKEAKELMSAEAVFDEPRQTGYFTIKMDPSVAERSDGSDMGMNFPAEGFGMYTSPQGSAFVMDKNVIVLPPGENAFMSQAEENEGFDALADPDELFEEMKDSNFTVKNVTASEVRGKPALKIDGTFTDDEGTHDVTIYMYQDPARIARMEMLVPAEDEQFAGALMTMDMLYGDEIVAEVPEGVTRALGLRYQSDRSSFGGFGGYGGSGADEDAPETWTFQVDGGIPLADVDAEVNEGMAEDDEPALWTMKLADGTKTVDALTLTFKDVDADGKVSQGDTLTIARGEGAESMSVSLRDLVTGYRVTPGAGLATVVLAAAAAVLLGRRA